MVLPEVHDSHDREGVGLRKDCGIGKCYRLHAHGLQEFQQTRLPGHCLSDQGRLSRSGEHLWAFTAQYFPRNFSLRQNPYSHIRLTRNPVLKLGFDKVRRKSTMLARRLAGSASNGKSPGYFGSVHFTGVSPDRSDRRASLPTMRRYAVCRQVNRSTGVRDILNQWHPQSSVRR